MALLVAAAIAVTTALSFPFDAERDDLVTHAVRYERLELTIVERGALESVDNSDVYCRVKAGAKNSTVATTIKSVIDDGSHVKAGELLVELDDSGLIEQLKAQKIVLDQKESEKVQAEENFKIVQSQNESDIKTAEVTLELAKIDLQKYLEGDFPQSLKDVDGRIKVAESDAELQRDRAAWAQRMVRKGYQTVSQATAEQSRLESLEIAMRKVQEERRVLTDPKFGMKKRTETDLANKVAEAERALLRIKGQAVAKEVQARTDREAKKSIHQQEQVRYHEVEDEIKKCKIFAPQDGMVVYYVPEQARFGGGSQQSIVAQGEPVREGQKLMQIPDLRHMQVNTRVHEALVSRVRKGLRATVRVDAYPDRTFAGHIASVATISSQQDWLSSDVKVYTTKVAIDETVDGLKPGMSAEVTIEVAQALEHVLAVPVQAVVGSVEMGSHRRVYVLTPAGPEARDVIVGQTNERMVEVKDGLMEGEQVVLNPKALVGETMKTRPANGSAPAVAPTTPTETTPTAPPAEKAERGKGGEGKSSGEDREKRQQEMLERFRKAAPSERKQMLEQVPEAYRGKVRERLQAAGVEVTE